MTSNTSTTRTPRPKHLRQGIDPDAKAKLQQIAVDGRLSELVRRDATQYLRRIRLQEWYDFYNSPLPMGPSLLPKSKRNIAAWTAMTPAQRAAQKAKDIAEAKAVRAEAKAKRQTKKEG